MQTNPRGNSPGVRVGKSFITITNSLFACDIKNLVKAYTRFANRYLESNGPVWTCDRLKNYYTIGCRLSLQLDTNSISFCKSKGKIPVDLVLFEKWLLSPNMNKRRAALTVLRLYTTIYTRASKDTSSIETEGPSILQFRKYSAFLDKICQKYKKFLKPRLRDETLYTTSKKGPNGPALLTVDKDYFAIKSSGILETIRALNDEISRTSTRSFEREVQLSNGFAPDFDAILDDDIIEGLSRSQRKEQVYDSMESFIQWRLKIEPRAYDNCITSKLGFLPEGGCKTRVIAIGDYFTQDCLKPIHRDLYRLLRKLDTDGTSSHNRISQLVKEKTRAGCVVWSFDLTSATDRFPIFIQERVLGWMYGTKVSALWRELMVNRDFVVDKGTTVRYAIGQPMGLLSSWAAFALTHHVIVEMCALMVGLPTFKEYVIIGDDVTIFNESVALKYMEFLKDMNIQISESKSLHSSGNPLSCAEIAKRLFINGSEISPMPYDAIESAITNHLLFPNLIRLAMERDIITSPSQWEPVQNCLSKVYNSKRYKDILVLISSPIQKLPLGITSDIWDGFDDLSIVSKFNEIKINFIKDKARGLYTRELMNIPDMGILGIALDGDMDPRKLAKHPLMTVLRAYRDRCGSIYQGIIIKGIKSDDLELIPFLVNPMIPQYMRRSHQIEKVRSTLILKTYRDLVTTRK